MARAPIEIGIASETKAFKQGIEAGIIKPVEDAATALDDLGRTDGPEKIERNLDAAADASERLQRETKETADSIEREFREAYRSQKQSADSAASKSSETMREVKSEALANASETFSSFDGSASSFVDGIQGTFGGLIAGLTPLLGPAGLFALVAGAGGVGLISSALGISEANAEAFRQKVSDLTSEFIEANSTGGRSAGAYVDELKKMATETDRGKANLVDMKMAADDLGLSMEDVTKAYIGGGSSLDELIEKTEDLLTEQQRMQTLGNSNGRKEGELAGDRINNLKDELRLYREQRDALQDAQDAQLLYLQSGASDFDVKVGLINQLNDAYDEAAGSSEDFVNKETGLFDTAAYIASMQAREQALRDYQTTLATSGLSTEAKAFLNEQGQEAAAQMLAGYKSADATTRAELDRIWTEAGKQNSGTYADTLTQDLSGTTVVGPTIAPQLPDAAALLRKIQSDLNSRRVTVPIDLTYRSGVPVL